MSNESRAKPIETAIEEFLTACAVDGLRPATVVWYKNMLKPFVARFAGVSIGTITAHDLRLYILDLKQRDGRYQSQESSHPVITGGLSENSLRDHAVALRRLFKWYAAEYHLADIPTNQIRIPSQPIQEPKAIDMDDAAKLIDATDGSATGLRDRAMLLFLLDTGCRVGGVVGLKLEHINLPARQAWVVEKGSKLRAVPFTRPTAEALRQWLLVRPDGAKTVFCSMANGSGYAGPLTMHGLADRIKELAKRAGVDGRINPHSFRHAFAREYLINGGDLATLSQLMGHASITITTDFYTRYTTPELAVQHEKFSPLNNLKFARNRDE